MSLKFKLNTREPPSKGIHLAVCIKVINLGTQNDPKYGLRDQIYLEFELADKKARDINGVELREPATVGRIFTNSPSPKSALRPFLESWRGETFSDVELKAFDIMSLLGKACSLGVVHRDGVNKIYANAATASPPPAGANPKPAGKLLGFDAEDWDKVTFQALPRWIQDKINNRVITEPAQKIEQPEPEPSDKSGTARSEGTTAAEPDPDDDIPF
jgi:hypothetical protein